MYCLSVSVSIVGTNVCYNDNSFHFVFFLVPKMKKQKKGIKDITHAVIRGRIQIQLLSN